MGSLEEVSARGLRLSAVLKALRRRRGLRPSEVAAALGMPLRSYERFESGRGRLDIERIHRVARVLDADPYAILLALETGSAEFALRCSDNKLMWILVMALRDFDAEAGDGLERLDPATLMAGFTEAFDGLLTVVRQRDIVLRRWLGGGDLDAGEGE